MLLEQLELAQELLKQLLVECIEQQPKQVMQLQVKSLQQSELKLEQMAKPWAEEALGPQGIQVELNHYQAQEHSLQPS